MMSPSLCCLAKASAHLFRHAKIRTFSRITLALNSTTMTILLSVQFQHMSSQSALVSSTGCKIAYVTNPTNSEWMHQCHPKHLHGYLNRFTPILWPFGVWTVRCCCPIRSQRLQPLVRCWWMVPSAFGFLQKTLAPGLQQPCRAESIGELVLNPSLICNQSLSKVNHNYRRPLHRSQLRMTCWSWSNQ